MESMTGSFVYVDTCEAVDDKLFFKIPINGARNPIIGRVLGLLEQLNPFIQVVINQEPPFECVIRQV